MSKPEQILPLTSLRFFAAMYVVLYHTLSRVFPHSDEVSTTHGRLLSLGFIAVSFFFTLSGYILAVTYLSRQVSKKQFWWARFARVYPLFFLTLLLDAPQYCAGLAKKVGTHAAIWNTTEMLAANILMLQAWIPHFRSIDWPNWSLSVEALFYLIFPFLLAIFVRLKTTWLIAIAVTSYALGMFADGSPLISMPRSTY